MDLTKQPIELAGTAHDQKAGPQANERHSTSEFEVQRSIGAHRSHLLGSLGPRSLLALAAVTLSCFAFLCGWIIFPIREHTPPTRQAQTSPFTSYPGNESTPSISPDGTRVAFEWNGPSQSNSDIYIKLLGPGEPIRLTANPAHGHDPAWSPDGKSIAFLRDASDGTRVIALIPALGGPERTVAHTRIVKDAIYPTEAPLLSWSVDGRYLFTLDTQGGNSGPYAVVRVSVETGERKAVTFPGQKDFGERAAAVSPDGRFLAFIRQASDATVTLQVVLLSSQLLPVGAPATILSGVRLEGFAWTPDSRELVFFADVVSGDVAGKLGLWHATVSGSRKLSRVAAIEPIPKRLKRMGQSRGITLAISQDGRRLLYSEGKFDANIWRVQLHEADRAKISPLIVSTRDELQPDYSSDGRKIAFESDRSGSEEVWVCNTDCSGAAQITNLGTGFSGSPRWSPENRHIAFDHLGARNWSIYVVRSDGGKPIRASSRSGNDVTPYWSPDAQWIYYASDRTGRFEIWKARATGGSETQITRNGGTLPVLSADGKYLYYSRSIGPSNIALWSMPVGGTAEIKIVEHLLSPRAYSAGKHGIYFIQGQSISSAPFGHSPEGNPPLRFFDMKSRQTRTIGSVQGNNLAGRIAVSPDERSLLDGHEDGSGSDLMLVENVQLTGGK